MRRMVLWVTLAFMSGCALIYPTAVPMRTHAYPAPATVGPERALLVLLPGRGDDADVFAQNGFIDDVRASGAPVDIVTVDAHLGYYLRSTVTERVWTDVIAPARARGYQHIWMAGVSMGGLGSLALAQDHPRAIEGLVLIAPYLGTDQVIAGIAKQGSAARWSATDPTDRYQQLWTWLKKAADPSADLPQIALAFGSSDRLSAAHRLLAGLLRPEQVTEIPGDHNWTTWKKLWRAYWNPAGTLALALARQ
jgi:pimeloyl-ACP methyl ester carboxylesterase